MKKDLLQKVLQNYPSSSAQEAEELEALKAAYPYSQVLHVLTARISKDNARDNQQNELQMAAVYSADRAVLKHMMSDQSGLPMPANELPPTKPAIRLSHAVQTMTPLKVERHEVAPSMILPQDIAFDNDDLAEQVIKDVHELYKTRHNFEMMFVDIPEPQLVTDVSGDESVKSRRERIIEMSKALNSQPGKEAEDVKPVKRKRAERKDIIDEIANTKNEIEPADEKQKQQLDIIENFIQAQPSISNAKDKPFQIQEGDLATIKTGDFGENVVSETLVELLLKQGKKDKAIEVLKKLIWKFPQKKSYFAAQIEELKK